MDRIILHLDLDAFFCSVEEIRDPTLRGKAFAVGGRPDARGVVASCSYPARKFGVHSAMPMARAVRICPGLLIVRGNFASYSAASKNVMAELKKLTPLVEQLSIDEAFLDISELGEDPEALAVSLQNSIERKTGLPCSIGVATNKLVAKIACDFGKGTKELGSPPRSVTVVPVGKEAAFLAPLEVRRLWGIGPKTEAKLAKSGVRTIGDLAQHPQAKLIKAFGKHGEGMASRANGIDNRPVVTTRTPKSFSQEITFSQDTGERVQLERELQKQSERIAKALQKQGLTAATIRIKVRWPDFTTLTRQLTLSEPTDQVPRIAAVARTLLKTVRKPDQPVRLLGVGVSKLTKNRGQLSLWNKKA